MTKEEPGAMPRHLYQDWTSILSSVLRSFHAKTHEKSKRFDARFTRWDEVKGRFWKVLELIGGSGDSDGSRLDLQRSL